MKQAVRARGAWRRRVARRAEQNDSRVLRGSRRRLGATPARHPLAVVLVAASCSVYLWSPARARACAACACGDPTVTVMGAQQPFDNRVRVALEFQHRRDGIGGSGVDRIELNEQRLSLSAAYAPWRWLMLSVSVPFVRRELSDVTLATDTLWGPGDAEVRARAFVFRDRAFAPTHLLAINTGMRLPTAPLDRDATGAYREPELQAGSGSFDPLLGLSYAWFAHPWSAYVSEIVYIPSRGRADFRVGTSWRGTHTLQYQFGTAFALRGGLDFRLEQRARSGSTIEPDSGGFVLFLSPSMVWTPATDLVLSASVHLPVLNALYGLHDEGVFFGLGAAYDI